MEIREREICSPLLCSPLFPHFFPHIAAPSHILCHVLCQRWITPAITISLINKCAKPAISRQRGLLFLLAAPRLGVKELVIVITIVFPTLINGKKGDTWNYINIKISPLSSKFCLKSKMLVFCRAFFLCPWAWTHSSNFFL